MVHKKIKLRISSNAGIIILIIGIIISFSLIQNNYEINEHTRKDSNFTTLTIINFSVNADESAQWNSYQFEIPAMDGNYKVIYPIIKKNYSSNIQYRKIYNISKDFSYQIDQNEYFIKSYYPSGIIVSQRKVSTDSREGHDAFVSNSKTSTGSIDMLEKGHYLEKIIIYSTDGYSANKDINNILGDKTNTSLYFTSGKSKYLSAHHKNIISWTGGISVQISLSKEGDEIPFRDINSQINEYTIESNQLTEGTYIFRARNWINSTNFEEINYTFNYFVPDQPIIDIEMGEISNYERNNATITIYDPVTNIKKKYDIEIKFRGGYSLNYPKKSFSIKFNSKKNILGFNEKILYLQAEYNDKTKIKNILGYKIYELVDKETIRSRSTDLFINDKYEGTYRLSERVDRDYVNFKKYYESDLTHSVLYKYLLYTQPYENECSKDILQKVTDVEEPDFEYYKPLEELCYFTMNSNESTFYKNIYDYIDKEYFIDYYLFIQLIGATDNLGKNYFLSKCNLNNCKFKIHPWDLDNTFQISNQIVSMEEYNQNSIFKRLLMRKKFMQELNKRWSELRSSVWTTKAIQKLVIETENEVKYTKERDGAIWSKYEDEYPTLEIFNNINTSEWIKDRLSFLDKEFENKSLN